MIPELLFPLVSTEKNVNLFRISLSIFSIKIDWFVFLSEESFIFDNLLFDVSCRISTPSKSESPGVFQEIFCDVLVAEGLAGHQDGLAEILGLGVDMRSRVVHNGSPFKSMGIFFYFTLRCSWMLRIQHLWHMAM